MDRFFSLEALISVIDEGGFAAAAKKLAVSPPVITRAIASLENELKTKLMQRTTRSFSLTEAGQAYLSRVRGVLSDLSDADLSLHGQSRLSAESLRIAAASSLGPSIVAPALAAFLNAHPKVTAELSLLDRPVHLANEGYDIVISIKMPDAQIPPMAQIPVVLTASPGYCAVKGRPRSPEDLTSHDGLTLQGEDAWALRDGTVISPKARGTSNRYEVIRALCLANLGIAIIPAFLIARDLRQGDLVALLDGFEPKPMALTMDINAKSAAGAEFRKHLSAFVRQLGL